MTRFSFSDRRIDQATLDDVTGLPEAKTMPRRMEKVHVFPSGELDHVSATPATTFDGS